MTPLFTVKGMNKKVRVWNSRKKQHLVVDVDYQKVEVGSLTLIHIARMRDTAGNDTRAGQPRERNLQIRWAD